MRSVFIIDDHDIVRFGLSTLLQPISELTIVGEAANVHDGLEGIKKYQPDLVISDMSMDDSRGLDTVRSVVAAQGKRHVLIISMHDELIYAEQVVALGARGYLMKEKAQQHAVTAVRAVLDGQIWVSVAVSALLLNRIKPRPSVQANLDQAKLSAREIEVLQRLSVGKTTKQVAFELGISARTVDYHRASLKRKLGLQSGSELISWAASIR